MLAIFLKTYVSLQPTCICASYKPTILRTRRVVEIKKEMAAAYSNQQSAPFPGTLRLSDIQTNPSGIRTKWFSPLQHATGAGVLRDNPLAVRKSTQAEQPLRGFDRTADKVHREIPGRPAASLRG